MRIIFTIVSFLLLSNISSYGQGFENKLIINNCFYSGNGEYAYIMSSSERMLFKLDLKTNVIIDKYEVPFEDENSIGLVRHMFFRNGKTYVVNSNRWIYTINEKTKSFDLYYQYQKKEYEFVEILGMNSQGNLLGYIKEDNNLNYGQRTWGKLLNINPSKNSSEEIVNHTVGGQYESTFEPVSNQLNITGNKIIYTDFSKFHFEKTRLMLYDFETKKSTVLDKKFIYGNYRLHAYNNVFVVEYFDSKAKEFNFYNPEGELIKKTGRDYVKTKFDPSTNQLFLLKKEMKKIDIYDLTTNTISKTITYNKSKFPRNFWGEEELLGNGAKISSWRNGKYVFLENLSYASGGLSEFLGVFYEFNPLTMETKPLNVLREGYTYEDYLEVKEAVTLKNKEELQNAILEDKITFQNTVNEIPLLSERGNMEGFRKKGGSPKIDAKKMGMIVPSEGYITHVAKLGKTKEGVILLVLTDDSKSDYIKNNTENKRIDMTYYNYNVAVITPDMKHMQSCFIGTEIYKNVSNFNTKETNSGYTQTIDFSWSRSGNKLTITSNSGKTCSFSLEE